MKLKSYQVKLLIAVICFGGVAHATHAAGPLPVAKTTTGVLTPTQLVYTASVPLSSFGDSYAVSGPYGVPLGMKSTPGSEQVSDAGGSAIVTASGLPYLSGSTIGGGEAQAVLTYSFEILDPTEPANPPTIDVGVSAIIKTSATTSGIPQQDFLQGSNMNAGFVIDGSGFKRESDIIYQYETLGGCSQCFNQSSADVTGTLGPTSSFAGTIVLDKQPVMLRTNLIHTITMFFTVRSGSYGGTNSAFASVDPTFTLPNGYQLLLSPGIGGAVPEPATWAMLILGLGGVGGATRNARRRQASEPIHVYASGRSFDSEAED